MTFIIGLFFFVLGTALGSFVNVVSLRYHTGRSISTGRSACFSCAETLRWYELVPLISYFALRGHCRSCGSAVSLQYPAVEFLSGIVFLGLFLVNQEVAVHSLFYFSLLMIYGMVITVLCTTILVYDLRHKIIPNAFVYPLIALSFISTVDLLAPFLVSLPRFGAGILMALPIAALWFFSRGRAMGLGDAKLALALGWLLGPSGAASAFLLAFWTGAIVGVLLITAQSLFKTSKHFTMKSEIPFAPFLILGFLLVFFFEINILELFV